MLAIRRVISLILALALFVGMVPPTVKAAESKENQIDRTVISHMPEENDTETTAEEETISEEATEKVMPETTEMASETATVTEETAEPGLEYAETEIPDQSSGEIIGSGTCGDHLTWTLTRDGVLTISGIGKMNNLDMYDSHGFSVGAVYCIIIEDGVTSIGDYAFSRLHEVESVSIPDSITSIGSNAFSECYALEHIEIPSSVTSIGSYAFWGCELITDLVIPDNVAFIGEYAFAGCTSLENVVLPNNLDAIHQGVFEGCVAIAEIVIPNNVISIGDYAFFACSSLCNVEIPNGVTSIGGSAFSVCQSLTHIVIPDSVTTITGSAFESCNNLTDILLPKALTVIDGASFRYCENLSSVFIPNGVTSIEYQAFWGCNITSVYLPQSLEYFGTCAFSDELTDVYYAGSEEQWNELIINSSYAYGNYWLGTANVHFNSTTLGGESTEQKYTYSIPGLTLNTFGEDTFYLFMGDPSIYCMSAPDALTHLELKYALGWDNGYDPANITWSSSDEEIVKVVWEDSDAELPGFIGLKTGTVTITATNPQGESFSFELTVVKPNAVEMTSVYDTKYYYSSGGFYSAASSISDSVEIFFALFNKPVEEYPCVIQEAIAGDLSTEQITVTATVSGNDLSFDRDTYQNTYTATYDGIPFESSIYDILTLFPTDINSFCSESASYAVKITFVSECFESPLTETYNFTVYNAEKLRAAEHISFIESDKTYIVSKENIYGRSMVSQKDDWEYIWSKWSTFDFDNYYEIVWADILLGMLDAAQVNISIVPSVLKEWYGNYKTLLGGIDTMVADKYSDLFDISETRIEKIDKVFKANKYDMEGVYADDEVYQAVLDTFGTVGNVDKIQGLFKAIDQTSQVADCVNFAGNVISDFVAWGNTISIMNAFKEADDELKAVCRSLANRIPSSEVKMRDAVEDYLNYSHDYSGFAQELFESFDGLFAKVGLDTFNSVVGKKAWDYVAASVVGYIGKIPYKGGVLASTTAFSTVTAAISGVATGVTLGLCLSDLICNSEDKAAEMGKLIAMCEYAPYIIEMLEGYERNLYSQRSNQSVLLFEKAFQIHQAAQSYIIDHTISSLQAKAESILYIVRGNQEYYKVISNALANKRAVDRMKCCGKLDTDTAITATKVIGVKCPVDVYIYDKSGNEVVQIVADLLQYVVDGLLVHIYESEKYIALPANQEYSVKIIATDAGSMDYQVLEYDENLTIEKELVKNDIPLVKDGVFTGIIPLANNSAPDDYALSTEESTFVPNEPEPTEPTPAEPPVDRIAGRGRCQTAIEAAETLKKLKGFEKFQTIVVADAANFPDALTGSYLAAVCKAPILLYLDGQTAVTDYINANLTDDGTVYILGEKDSVSESLEANLKEGVTSLRLAGRSRYATCLEILEKADSLRSTKTEAVLVCSALNFADSLSASATGLPILLVKGTDSTLTTAQLDYLNGLSDVEIYVIGGKNTVSDDILAILHGYDRNGTAERISGTSREKTSAAVAEKFFPEAKTATLAFSQNFPDGLSGGPVAYALKAPLLLIAKDKEAAAANYVAERKITEGYVFGGNDILSDLSVEKIFVNSKVTE